MNKVIYIFCFSLTINIHASHPLAGQDFYQPTVNVLNNPLCTLDEELDPFLNPDFSKELYQVHEEIWRQQINIEAKTEVAKLEEDFNKSVMMTYAQEQRNKTPLTSNASITNSSIGYLNRLSGLSSSLPNRSFSQKQ